MHVAEAEREDVEDDRNGRDSTADEHGAGMRDDWRDSTRWSGGKVDEGVVWNEFQMIPLVNAIYFQG